jgi:hypothetical protein
MKVKPVIVGLPWSTADCTKPYRTGVALSRSGTGSLINCQSLQLVSLVPREVRVEECLISYHHGTVGLQVKHVIITAANRGALGRC